jgi:hypothetical protein
MNQFNFIYNDTFYRLRKELVGKSLFDFGDYFKDYIEYIKKEGNLKGLEDYCNRTNQDYNKKLKLSCEIIIIYVNNYFFDYEVIVPRFISSYDVKENTESYQKWKNLIQNL